MASQTETIQSTQNLYECGLYHDGVSKVRLHRNEYLSNSQQRTENGGRKRVQLYSRHNTCICMDRLKKKKNTECLTNTEQPRFKPSTSRVQVTRFTATANLVIVDIYELKQYDPLSRPIVG